MLPTEQEWLEGCCYRRMYGAVRGWATTRQLRLYMAACCRLLADDFFDPRMSRALEVVEWCADNPQAEEELTEVWEQLMTRYPRAPITSANGELAQVVEGAWQLLEEWWGSGEEYKNTRHALAHAVFLSLRELPGQVFTGGAGDAAEYCSLAVEHALILRTGGTPGEHDLGGAELEGDASRAIANLLREIFGNPYRAIQFETSALTWRRGLIARMARDIYQHKAFKVDDALGRMMHGLVGHSDVLLIGQGVPGRLTRRHQRAGESPSKAR